MIWGRVIHTPFYNHAAHAVASNFFEVGANCVVDPLIVAGGEVVEAVLKIDQGKKKYFGVLE